MLKPLRIARSPLTGQYYAFRSYTEEPKTGTLMVTGKKEDITEQIERIVAERKKEAK